MAESVDNRTRSILVVCLLPLACCFLSNLSCSVNMHSYVICAEPIPKVMSLNGQPQELGENGCFLMEQDFGEHTVHVQFRDGTSKTLVVYPNFFTDSEYPGLQIKRDRIVSRSLRYRVVDE